jgi:hypothetical protein
MACVTRDSSPIPNRSLPQRRRAVVCWHNHHASASFSQAPFLVSARCTSASPSAANLQTWLPLSTNTFGLGLFQFLDSGSATNPIRFYRTRY